jgi:hypothetical protein
MTQITSILASLFRPSRSAGFAAAATEPLDHPCLISARHAFLDDLPRPVFAVNSDGSISLVAEA